MRLFVAAELPANMVEALSETSALVRSCVHGRFVAPDSFHVTLAFLGERAGSEVAGLESLLDEACASSAAFTTALGALGTFGRANRATLWQGFCGGGEQWASLASAVQKNLSAAGYAPEHKRFVPHVTLMRQADVSCASLPMPCVERGRIDTVTLFLSDLSGSRPRYEALARFGLR